MKCPRCGYEESAVTDSRGDGSAIRRRRECESCKFRFTTYERVEKTLPMVVKKDGRREAFEREKIRSGLLKACEKTPISVDSIDRAVEEIETQIVELFAKEISSRQVGEFVMEALKKLDKVAYVRFASVYREFSDISQFVDTLHALSAKKAEAKRVETKRSKRQQ